MKTEDIIQRARELLIDATQAELALVIVICEPKKNRTGVLSNMDKALVLDTLQAGREIVRIGKKAAADIVGDPSQS